MVAPASMRAISSRRSVASSGTTRVATRSVLPDTPSLAMRKWLDARAATCGAWVTAMTWTRPGKAHQPLADGIGDGASDPGVDLVEDERRRGALVGQNDLQREHEPRKLAARGDLHERPRAGTGVRLGPELHAVAAGRIPAFGIRFDFGDEACALELEGRQFGLNSAVERLGGLAPPGRQNLGRRDIGLVGLRNRSLQGGKPLLARVDGGDIRHEPVPQGGKIVGGHVVFARRGAQREQTLLGPFEIARIELRRADCGLERRSRLVDRQGARHRAP